MDTTITRTRTARKVQSTLDKVLAETGLTREEAIARIGTKKKGLFWDGKHFMYANTRGYTEPARPNHIIETLHNYEDKKLDRSLTWWDEFVDGLVQVCLDAKGFIAALTLLGGCASVYLTRADDAYLTRTPKAYKDQRTAIVSSLTGLDEESQGMPDADLVRRVCMETGIQEKILRTMLEFGLSDDSRRLRDKGYVGIIPVPPEQVGVVGRILQDPYIAMLSFAQQFKQLRKRTNDDETALALYITSEENVKEAKDTGADASALLYSRDRKIMENGPRIERLQRFMSLMEYSRDGKDPEALFQPIRPIRRSETTWDSEEDLRGFYNRTQGWQDHAYGQSHYEKLKNDLELATGAMPEEKLETMKRESVWFANLPAYAARTIARLHDDD